MSFHLSLSHVFFEYDSSTEPLFQDLTLQLSSGWTGIVGANGSGKTTLLKLIAGQLVPSAGTVRTGGCCCLCEQNVNVPPRDAAGFLESYEHEAIRLRERLCIKPEMLGRWESLSMGERKKIQIGTALYLKPDILCIDEPTNHLDYAARELLLTSLQQFHGIGVLVTHDRMLADALCRQCLFLRRNSAALRSGGISQGAAEEEVEQEQSRQEYRLLKRELKRNAAELQRRREKERKAERNNSKRKIDRKDYDAKGKIDLARVSGRSRSAGDLAGAQAKIVADKRAELEAFEVAKKHTLGLHIPYGSRSPKNFLLEFPAREIRLGGEKRLLVPDLEIRSSDRIALTGVNGSGKSSLLRRLAKELNLDEEHVLYLPQELEHEMQGRIYDALRGLGRGEFSRVMNVVASLGSVPERVLESRTCSPGEWRKLFFGLGVLKQIHLIIMDEPTNHLDYPSIECLEAALRDVECALLLVSHDLIFLKNLCSLHWRIESGGEKRNLLKKELWRT